MASTYLSRTPASAGNRKTWTWSAWIKMSKLGNVENIFTAGSASDDGAVRYLSGGNFNLYETNSSGTAYSFNLETNALYRDVNGWYHLVVGVDTTQATASDRVKMYVNGSQVTFSGSAYPSQNFDTFINNNVAHYISRAINTTYGTREFDGSMSHIHFIDGTQYQASDFGQYDANGVWTIKISPSVTYGTNGFFILKDGNSVTDQSGNGNNFTVAGGTLTNTEDNPSNVFATLNALSTGIDQTLSNGNTTMVSGTATTRTPSQTTLGMSSGKYYAEFKITDSAEAIPGVAYTQSNYSVSSGVGYYPGYTSSAWGYLGSASAVYNNASSVGGTWSSFTSGDIIGIAINLDDTQGGLNKLYFSKNGVWQNGADPSNYSSTTGVVGITAPSSTTDGYYYFSVGDGSGATTSGIQCNFGNGYFGTTAVSSAGTNASGNGIFEYDVPTGYTALSTKGLNL